MKSISLRVVNAAKGVVVVVVAAGVGAIEVTSVASGMPIPSTVVPSHT